MRPDQFRNADKKSKRKPPEPRRRSVEEIKADLDAIAAEYERIHGRSLLPERPPDLSRPA